MQRFLPFLPDGEGAGGEALAVIHDDVQWLLTADAAELWDVAKADSSLVLLIGTFLQYARCDGRARMPHKWCRTAATVLAVLPQRWRMLPTAGGGRVDGGGGSHQQRVQSPLLALRFLLCCRPPYDEGFQQQSATELAVWQHMLPLLHRL